MRRTTNFSQGDTIHLATGCTWHQEIYLNAAATSANPIVVQPYG